MIMHARSAKRYGISHTARDLLEPTSAVGLWGRRRSFPIVESGNGIADAATKACYFVAQLWYWFLYQNRYRTRSVGELDNNNVYNSRGRLDQRTRVKFCVASAAEISLLTDWVR